MSLLNDVLVDLDRRSANTADEAIHTAAEPANRPGPVAMDRAAAAKPGVDYVRWAGWLLAGLGCIAVVGGWFVQEEVKHQTAEAPLTGEQRASPSVELADARHPTRAVASEPSHRHATPADASQLESEPGGSEPPSTQPVTSTQTNDAPLDAAQLASVQPAEPEILGDPAERLASVEPHYIALRNVESPSASAPRTMQPRPVKSRADVGDSALEKARAQIDNGELSSAELTLTQHLERLPDDRVARELQVGLILRGGRHGDALRAIDEGLSHHPGSAKLLLIKARLLAEQGDVPAAVALLRRLATGDTPSTDTLLLLGALYQQQGQYALAVEVYRRLLVVQPTAGPAWVGLAIGLDGLGKPEALAAYQRALRLGGLPSAAERYARQRKAELESGNG